MSSTAGILRSEYPRPQFQRDRWVNLNGKWTYTFDFGESGGDKGRELFKSKGFTDTIVVPFCPESRLSGIGYTDFIRAMWYHRKLEIPADWAGLRPVLHFGGVDFESEIYIDGISVGVHFGGMSSFEFDLSPWVSAGGTYDLVVRVRDITRDPESGQPRGKQSPSYKSAGCAYTRTTGIWQTVWLEGVPAGGLRECFIIPDLDNGRFAFIPSFYDVGAGSVFSVEIGGDGVQTVTSQSSAQNGTPVFVALPEARPWSPETPFLYDIVFRVLDSSGRLVDEVTSYGGLRKIHCEDGHLMLNNKPFYLRLVLDQGFYPDGIWTAPSDEALRRDIELAKAAGFNGARLHQKVFEERFHYWADKLGYVTWGESASWGCDYTRPQDARNFLAEWREVLVRDRSHPSIIVWTPLNETWRDSIPKEHKRFHVDCYELCKAIDSTRPVNDASGYLHVKTDLWTIHNYWRADRLREIDTVRGEVWTDESHKGREVPYAGQPYIIDEFGGLKWIPRDRDSFADNTWGYGDEIADEEEFYRVLEKELEVIFSAKNIVGYCYTQLTDVEQEQNGIYNYDRSQKFDMKRIRKIFTGEGR